MNSNRFFYAWTIYHTNPNSDFKLTPCPKIFLVRRAAIFEGLVEANKAFGVQLDANSIDEFTRMTEYIFNKYPDTDRLDFLEMYGFVINRHILSY